MPAYTPKQGQYLAFIAAYTARHGRPPAETDLQRHFRVSPPTVHQMVLTLEARGFISRMPGTPRSIRVLLSEDELPPLEVTLAGSATVVRPPTFAEQYPTVADWIMHQGWVEIGHDDCRASMVRALDAGGMVWEGRAQYATVDDLLADLEAHLLIWHRENG